MGAAAKIPVLKTATNMSNNESSSHAPSVALVTSSTTQVPVCIIHAISVTAGEEPLYLVKMKDGTFAYIRESLLTQSGSIVIL